MSARDAKAHEVRAKRGPAKRVLESRVMRVAITGEFAHLCAFFKRLDALPRGQRSRVLLTALDHGADAAQESLAQSAESNRIARGIDSMLDEW